ncbi:hypothetical protein OESDEN_25193 [Oesophagostomum dentatum]|uniref:Uncharacterized protein n=1 Tax=Oesophagostomum dentatum TaxID=61180 RepID=A0A0B1RU86_OESDE|nr:hypothetical protein OESDEN_25193 [Oesophagostomum dentatum]
MFEDGSRALEAKNFLLKQPQLAETTLEAQTYVGADASKEGELWSKVFFKNLSYLCYHFLI